MPQALRYVRDLDLGTKTANLVKQMGKRSSQKGSRFERDICKFLSLWWTKGKRDDIYYRTAGSGARATNRSKQGKTTANSAGDVGALDSLGEPFLKKVSVEIKRGYNQVETQHTVDVTPSSKLPVLHEWIEQAKQSKRNAGATWWIVIHKRDSKDVVVHFPWSLLVHLSKQLNDHGPLDTVSRFGKFQITMYDTRKRKSCVFVTVRLDSIDQVFDPSYFVD